MIFQESLSRELLIFVMNNRTAGMRIEFGDSCICFLGAPDLNHEGTGLIFALKNMTFGICLIDLIGLTIIENMVIDGFTSFCNRCKGVINSNHDSSDELIIVNRYRDNVYYYISCVRGLEQMAV